MRIYGINVVPAGVGGGVSRAPARILRPGSVVEVWPLAENTKTAYVAADGDPNSLLYEGSSFQVAVGAQSAMILPIVNLADIVVKTGATNDGISIRVRENA